MKKALFTLAFMGFLVIGASAQYFHRYKALPDADQPLREDKPLSFYPEHKPQVFGPDFRFKNPEIMNNKTERKYKIARHDYDNMPNYQPMGIYPSRIINPNDGVKHSLIITDPLKIRIAKDLTEDSDK